MLEVARRLRGAGLRSRMLLQVHDELVLEAPEAEVPRTMAEVREAMANAVVDNIVALLEGRRPPNIVNPEVLS